MITFALDQLKDLPIYKYAKVGENVTFKCNVTVRGKEFVQWQLPNGNSRIGCTLDLIYVTKTDEGLYTSQLFNGTEVTTTAMFFLTVLGKISLLDFLSDSVISICFPCDFFWSNCERSIYFCKKKSKLNYCFA